MMRRVLALVAALVAVATIGIIPTAPAPSAEALTPAQWDPGYIISDAVFYDTTTMTAAGIQAFLNGKVSSCRSGYTCLKDYVQDTATKPAQTHRPNHCGQYDGASRESAAQIIYKAAMACRINPQVLLVLLQKEQSLVTDTWPTPTQYARATGFACPDTAPCDPRFASFADQVYNAAWQFRQYTVTPNSWNYRVGTNVIGYNPTPQCGASVVNIRNQATANLYIYTPYQPNSATLNYKLAGGAAISAAYPDCGAFGNINFAILFEGWFGSPTGNRHGNVDRVEGVRGGIHIKGWAVDPTQAGTSYIWVNVNGTGGPFAVNKPLPWFDALYPGYGPNHGFEETIAAAPGDHEVCIYGSVSLLSCTMVRVPKGSGSLDSVTALPGALQIDGWSVDFTTTAPSYIWINVDGHGGPYIADKSLAWFEALYPDAGLNHGYSVRIPAAKGKHEVCVHGSEALLGCRTVTITRSDDGALDSVTLAGGGIRVQGWSVDLTTTDPSYIWINVNGTGGPYRADRPLEWFEALYPGAGLNHGFDVNVPVRAGRNEVCVYGSSSLLGCRVVTTAIGDGALDSAIGGAGSITLSGWSVDLRTADPSYIWVNVDGVGGPHRADRTVPWFGALYPGLGTEHGYDVTVPATPGSHQVCVYGTEKLLGCRTVTVS